jgi:hypothetical protein
VRRQSFLLAAALAHCTAIAMVCILGSISLIAHGHTLLSAFSEPNVPSDPAKAHWASDSPRGFNFARKAVKTYLHLAGIETGYGFFAPNVPNAYRLQIAVLDERARVIQSGLLAAERGETDLRLASLLDALGRSPAGEVRDIIFELMAQAIFKEYPEAAEVRLRVEAIRMPALAEFKKDQAPSYQLTYAYDFGRADIRPSLAP